MLPSGTITFVLTDIQGSSRLWDREPHSMRQAHVRHMEIIAECVARHHGTLVLEQGEGDSTFSWFPAAEDGAAAMADIQRALLEETWPTSSPLRVRAALHTGAPAPETERYNATAVNRCARLRAIAHGGQTLLSEATYDLLRDSLPQGLTLQDMGQHRLKDLQRPEHVFQLNYEGGQTTFPPLLSLEHRPNNLPQQLTSFIGRERELEEVKRLLRSSRILTLTGSGGTGKTRLALQAATNELDDYADGIWFVELAPLGDPSLVPKAVSSTIGLREEGGRSIIEVLTEHLKPKSLLLILDNCEHVLAACAQLSDTLLRSCRDVKVLCTSREALGIAGECVYPVPCLSLPTEHGNLTANALSSFEGAALFVERARSYQPAFALTDANAAAVGQVCRRLDGIPLALELAAARITSLSVQEINDRLDHRFRLLTGGSRTALPRQQTLRSLIDWSYDLLTESEKLLLRRLSVFVGGWMLDAAETVCSFEGIEDWEVLDLLTGLIGKSLVLAESRGGTTRYRLLETVRQYARERLLDAAGGLPVRDRHLDWCVGLAERSEVELVGPNQQQWIDRLEADHDNMRAGLAWYLDEPDRAVASAGVRLGASLCRFWETHGHYSEGRRWLQQIMALPDAQVRTPERARVASAAGILAMRQCDYASAEPLTRESLSIWSELGDQPGIAHCLNNLGLIAYDQGEYASAATLHQQSLEIQRELANRRGTAGSLTNLGLVALAEEDYGRASPLFDEALSISREIGDRRGIAIALLSLGIVTMVGGELSRARDLFAESLAIRSRLGDRGAMAYNLAGLASVATKQGDQIRAVKLWAAENALREEIGSPRPPNLDWYEDQVAAARLEMGEARFDNAWAQGRAMSLDEAVEFALSGWSETAAP